MPGAPPCSTISGARATFLRKAERLEKNPLRILDLKQHQDFPVVDSAPVIDDFYPEAAAFFAEVTAGLDAIGIA